MAQAEQVLIESQRFEEFSLLSDPKALANARKKMAELEAKTRQKFISKHSSEGIRFHDRN
jgi:hypothetical protein